MDLVIVTGLSGAGRHSVLEALEDRGFTALDNLPVRMLEPLIELESRLHPDASLAVGMDSRHEDFAAEFEPLVEQLQGRSQPIQVLFLEASDDVLLRRYSETRRVHHLAARHGLSLPEAIQRERVMLAPIRELASAILDTSRLSLGELRQRLGEALHLEGGSGSQLRLLSFGFKYGVPGDADVVLDARFLSNPYYVPGLREQTGREAAVRDYVLQQPDAQRFLDQAEAWMRWTLPLIAQEGRAYYTLAIGCTGGKHRSVTLVEALAQRLKDAAPGLRVQHRELG
ncbi:MAG TPA: RNase adapter RapZ [Holophagaceae bacterium]|nr:RNase adapter RapZ [Holophagaceae bacterium]